ncbi:MAG: tRNA (adenosine(37)-N6)-threonylcarbamoyltransferase complex ATPase subunit type 1 TsaE [Saprospiraceae bacterium]
MELKVRNIEALAATARTLLDFAGDRKVMAFSGEIGAGKTTFIQAICVQLGVKERVTSPTFSLVNVYSSAGNSDREEEIFHLDLYRMKDVQEALDMGIEEYLYGDQYCFIEWPDIISALLPSDTLHISIELTENSHRKIVLL